MSMSWRSDWHPGRLALVCGGVPEDTEATQMKLNGRRIRDQQIRIQYCIPGVRAINIHDEVTTSFPSCDLTDPWPTVC